VFLSEIPGYRRCAERAEKLEDARRDYAWLNLDYELNIAGAQPRGEGSPATGRKLIVRPLSLRMFTQLCAVRSPFLMGGSIRAEHVAQILWRISPSYSPTDKESRLAFLASIAHLPFSGTVRAINRYLDLMLFDRPATSPARGKGHGPDTSFAASIVHEMASAYGWSSETTMDVPLPQLFQLLRKIQRQHDPEMASSHPLREKIDQKFFKLAVAKMNAAGPARA
jgi:hypothetical protein